MIQPGSMYRQAPAYRQKTLDELKKSKLLPDQSHDYTFLTVGMFFI